VDSTPAPDAPDNQPDTPPSTAQNPPPDTPPSMPSPPPVGAAVCVLVPIVAVLWVPWFNRMTPEVLGFPFFYWYQLACVVVTAVLMIVAFHAVRRDEAARRGRTGAAR